MTGTFKRIVSSFDEGMTEMVSLVDAVKIVMAPTLWGCRGAEDIERDIIRSLKETETPHNDVCCLSNNEPYIPVWNNVQHLRWVTNIKWVLEDAIKYGIAYRTSMGLSFGWQKTKGYYVFFVTHPKREMLGEKSSLRDAIVGAGWHETGEVVSEIRISSYECDSCGGSHSTNLTIGRDYRYRNYTDYPKVIGGSGFGAPHAEIECHSCEETRRADRLQVVGRKKITVEEARQLAKDHGVEIPHGFFDPVATNVIAGFFETMRHGMAEQSA